MNDKRKKFCQEYVKDFNGTQAAKRAGYSKHTANEQASQLLANLSIQQEIQKSLKKSADASDVTVKFIIEGFLEVLERCLQRKAVMVFDRAEKTYIQAVDDNGEGVWSFDAAGANKALEMLGKYKVMFTDVRKHEVGDELGTFFKNWSDMKVAAEKDKE